MTQEKPLVSSTGHLESTMKKPTFTIIKLNVCLAILDVLSTVCQAKAVADSNGKFVLSDRSFAIESSIARYTGYRQLQTMHLSERYSYEQKRAKIKYRLGSEQQIMLEEFYYDLETGASMSFNREHLFCDNQTIEDLYANLYGMNSAPLAELMQLAGSSANTRHLIGPASLLFLVAVRANEMRAIFWPAQKKSAFIRNHRVAEFVLELSSKKLTRFVLQVYYDRSAFEDANRSLVDLVPLQIVIKTHGGDLPVVVDYYKYRLTPLEATMQQHWPLQLDEFIFPVALNCAALVASKMPERDLFGSHDFERLRVSFRASSLWQREQDSKQINHFVAYDGMTQSMRIDYSFEQDANYASCLTDSRLGRTYSSIGNNGSGCLVMQTLKAVGLEASGAQLTFARLLIGSDRKLSYIGRAQVRGARAQVFEVSSDQLPQWFSQPQPVRSTPQNGSLVKRHFGFGLMTEDDERQQQRYNTLVYMSDDLLRLLQLEIYDLNGPKRSQEQRIILSAVIKDFLYELDGATNGDSKTNMFDLRDRCGSNGPNDSYTQVELLLEEESAVGEDSEGFYRGGHWLVNYVKRNAALFSSLSESLNLPLNSIYNLGSRLLASDHKVRLSVSFRVAEHPRHFHNVHFLGNAKVKTPKGLEMIHPVQSPNECYLRLLNEKPGRDNEGPIYLFYDQQTSKCFANRDHRQVSDEKTKKKKKIVRSGLQVDLRELEQFDLNTTSGELFMFEPSKDFASSLVNSWLHEEKFEHLEGKLLVLQATQPDDTRRPLEPHKVRTRIRRAKLGGVNQVSRVAEATGDHRHRRQLVGLSFSPRTETTVAQGATSFIKCEAACLEATWCHMFSFCLRHSQAQCLLSGATLLDHHENQDQSATSLEMGDLVADARCQLGEKRHLDLFQLDWPSTQTLGASAKAVAAAQSAEDCARLCSMHNLKLLRSPEEISSFCRQFSYLSRELSDRERQALGSVKGSANKFCLFKKHLSGLTDPITSSESDISVTFVALATFQFKFELLYERVQSIGLIGSTHDEANIQVRIDHLDLNKCAERCLLQLSTITCRSFDLQTLANTAVCILNTASMNNKELIRRAPEGVRLWHYEPRFESHNSTINEFPETWGSSSSFYGFQASLSLSLPVAAAIATGILLGRRMARRLLGPIVDPDDGLNTKLALQDYQLRSLD